MNGFRKLYEQVIHFTLKKKKSIILEMVKWRFAKANFSNTVSLLSDSARPQFGSDPDFFVLINKPHDVLSRVFTIKLIRGLPFGC